MDAELERQMLSFLFGDDTTESTDDSDTIFVLDDDDEGIDLSWLDNSE